MVEIIVVDNNSQDGSADMLQKAQSSKSKVQNQNLKLKSIFNKENTGFGRANNQGVKAAKSDYILLLNSDIVVLEDAINKIYKFYKQNEREINFLGAKLLNNDMGLQPSVAPFYSLPVVFAALFLRGDYWGLTRSSPNEVKKVDWVSGACILTKKLCFNKIKGFDEKVFMYMDEVDLLYRARQKNMTTYFYPEARFIHLGSASSGGRSFPIIQVFSGLTYFYKKHHSKFERFLLIIILKLKATIGLILGYLFNNSYLKDTYGKAYQMAKLD